MAGPVLTLPPTNPPSLQPIDALIRHVCSYVGASEDPELRNMALTFLDRSADRLNLMGVHLWTLREHSETLTLDQSSASLPSDWGGVYGTPMIVDADGGDPSPVPWWPWDQFRALDFTEDGTPEYLSIKSPIYDGLFYIYPKVDSGAVGQILKIPYYAKVNRPSEASDLYLSDEAREALLTGGVAFMLQWRHSREPNVWGAYFADFERQAYQARAAAARWIDEAGGLGFTVDSSMGANWDNTAADTMFIPEG